MAETMSEIKNSASDQKPATCTRKTLVNELRARGWSKRKAQKVLNAFCDAITEALIRNETVETPLGTFSVHRHRGAKKTIERNIRNIHTKQKQRVTTTCPGNRRVVRYNPAPEISPPRPKRNEKAEIRKCLEQLSNGRTIPDAMVTGILQVRKETHSTPNQLIGVLPQLLKQQRGVMTPGEVFYFVAQGLGHPMQWQEAVARSNAWLWWMAAPK